MDTGIQFNCGFSFFNLLGTALGALYPLFPTHISSSMSSSESLLLYGTRPLVVGNLKLRKILHLHKSHLQKKKKKWFAFVSYWTHLHTNICIANLVNNQQNHSHLFFNRCHFNKYKQTISTFLTPYKLT